MVTKQVPAEMAEDDADAARERKRQAAHHRADDAESAIQNAPAAGAVLGKAFAPNAVENAAALCALRGKVHGRILWDGCYPHGE